MGTHFVKEGNAFYEIDDDCMKKKEMESGKWQRQREGLGEKQAAADARGKEKEK